jgi:hypothetical protein
MENEEKKNRNKGGRPARIDPAVHRYTISLNDKENSRFLILFET